MLTNEEILDHCIKRGFSSVRHPRRWSDGYSHTRAGAAAGRNPPGPCSAPHRSSQGTSRRSNTVPPWGPAPPGSSSRAPTSRHLCGIENQYK